MPIRNYPFTIIRPGDIYSSQSGFEISPSNPLFPREELGEFLK